MRLLVISAAFALCLSGAIPAAAGTFGIGANMGFTSITPDVGRDTQIVGWPASAVGFQPGVRFSYITEAGTHEGFLDTGLLRLSGGGESTTYMLLSGNYQYNFLLTGKVRPYLTAGAGIHRVSLGSDFVPDESDNSLVFGGGGGIRLPVSADHGAIRLEARYDHAGNGNNFLSSAGMFTFRAGFDLWMK